MAALLRMKGRVVSTSVADEFESIPPGVMGRVEYAFVPSVHSQKYPNNAWSRRPKSRMSVIIRKVHSINAWEDVFRMLEQCRGKPLLQTGEGGVDKADG